MKTILELTDRQESILKDAVNLWGEPVQILKAIEEFSELNKALCKYLNNGRSVNHLLIDEMADTFIMWKQLYDHVMDEEDRLDCDIVIAQKLERLKERIRNNGKR